jgi:Phycobilisome protein
MLNDFKEFPNPLRSSLRELFDTMSRLQEEIAKLSARLSNSRQDFKQSIEDFFQQPNQNPFPTGGTIDDDFEQYVRLVSYCLEAGDTEILSRWGIQNILANPGILASENYELYSLAFNNAREESETPLEEECWIKIIEMFQILQNPGGAAAYVESR